MFAWELMRYRENLILASMIICLYSFGQRVFLEVRKMEGCWQRLKEEDHHVAVGLSVPLVQLKQKLYTHT